jgi:hypothetical protein
MNQPHLPSSLYKIDAKQNIRYDSKVLLNKHVTQFYDGDFTPLYDLSKISGATDIGMPSRHAE